MSLKQLGTSSLCYRSGAKDALLIRRQPHLAPWPSRWVCSLLPQAMEPASGQAASTSPFALPAEP